jgi:hypothetical protein
MGAVERSTRACEAVHTAYAVLLLCPAKLETVSHPVNLSKHETVAEPVVTPGLQHVLTSPRQFVGCQESLPDWKLNSSVFLSSTLRKLTQLPGIHATPIIRESRGVIPKRKSILVLALSDGVGVQLGVRLSVEICLTFLRLYPRAALYSMKQLSFRC